VALEAIEIFNPYPGNARRGDVGMIADSLELHGQYKPIVVNKGTKAPGLANTILAGNHTWQAALQLGWEKIDVHWVDVDEHQARNIVLIDNKANDSATYDVEALVDMLTEFPDLEGTGFTRDELDTLLEELDTPDEADIPDMPADTGPENYNLLVECDSEDEAKLLRTKLRAEGYTCGLA
jgi:ParB-like chromosome segregation protein Spo0J